MCIRDSGSRWGCGDNRYGQLGDGSTDYPEYMTKVQDNGVKKISTGWEHTLILGKDGILRGCGLNRFGQLGMNQNVETMTDPSQILTNVKDVYAFDFTSFAILNNGTLYGWGNNDKGQLGDGTTVRQQYPKKLRNNIRKVAAGGNFTMFLTTTGDLMLTGTIK